MTDYSKLSDFLINAAVGSATGYATASAPVLNIVIRNSNGRKCDPCNSWADAGPSSVASNISLHATSFNEGWMAEFTGNDEDVNDGFEVDYFESRHQNPLRAAMIVFLMMNEGEL